MKQWLRPISVVLGLAVLALTAGLWAPPLLSFVGANSDLIQGLTALVQLVLWVGAGVAFLVGLRRGRSTVVTPPGESIQARGGVATVASQGSVAAGQVAVSHDVYGDVILVANPEDLWRIIAGRRPTEDIRQATERYLQHLVDRYRYLGFKGMGVSDRIALRLPLVSMYVPLKARVELPKGETWARDLRLAGRKLPAEAQEMVGERMSEPQPVVSLMQENDGLIVLGDPGAGKTTFLKYVAVRLALGEGEALNLGPRLPVLLPLSAYANTLAEKDVPLDRFIADYYHSRGVGLPLQPMLDEALKRGGAVVMLDGLDEVKDPNLRHLVVERVVDFYTFHRRQGNKFVLTSRIVGYREVRPTAEGLAECTLVDFDDEEIELFVQRWAQAIEDAARGKTPVAAQEAERERKELLAAVHHDPGVRRLAANPLLLTILALMKRQGVMLPERRVELYQKYVETLLSTWNRARGLGRPPTRGLDVVETVRILAPLALWMHQVAPGVGLVKQGDLQRQLVEIYTGRGEVDSEVAARRFLADVREHAGLLLERGPGTYGFIHLTFEEYLAAVAVAQKGQQDVDPVAEVLAEHIDDPAWREVILLTIGYLGIVQQRDEAAGAVVGTLIEQQPGEPGQAVAVAGQAVVDAWPGGVTPACREQVVQRLVETLEDDEQVELTLRAASGDALARLRDPRPGVGLREDGLPDIVWCEVPAGPFHMGSDKSKDREAYEDELLQHEVILSAYAISKYPITNIQYAAFVATGGYQERCYWTESGWQWKRDRTGPGTHGGVFDLPNHPVVSVSWYEAVAFCRWLTERLRETSEIAPDQEVMLPTEAQWEKAARSDNGRIFPWGDEFDAAKCNMGDTVIGATSAVGIFPAGASPYGALDMSGNVWEWCSSLRREYPYDPDDGREDLGAEGTRVLRGGAFYYSHRDVRCACRYRSSSYGSYWSIGFRVVLVAHNLPLLPEMPDGVGFTA